MLSTGSRTLSENVGEQVLLLAGGLGSRLAALNFGVPKCLAPVNGRPFLEFKLHSLAMLGFSKVTILAGFGSEQITQFLQSNDFGQLEIETRHDQTLGQGTGKSVIDAMPAAESVFVAYGDSLVDVSLSDMHQVSQATQASVMAIESSFREDLQKGNVRRRQGSEPRILYSTIGDPSYEFVDHGLLLLRRQDVMQSTKAGCELSHLGGMLERISDYGKLAGVNALRPYLEIGTPASWERAQDTLLDYYRGYEVS